MVRFAHFTKYHATKEEAVKALKKMAPEISAVFNCPENTSINKCTGWDGESDHCNCRRTRILIKTKNYTNDSSIDEEWIAHAIAY